MVGSFAVVFGFLVKLLPISWFKSIRVNEEPLTTDDERIMAFRSSLRKSRSIFQQSGVKLNESAGGVN